MPTRDKAPTGAPCWIDLMTSDPDRSRAFYGPLFGWEAEAPNEDFGGYFNFTKDGVRVAGCIGSRSGSSAPDVWSVYLATDDADKSVGAVVASGGQVMVTAIDVGDLGTMSYAIDPGGAGIGIWQAGGHQGFGVLGEPGTPAWFELHSRDYDTAVSFYRDAFGWDIEVASEGPDFRYSTLGRGEGQLAGIMDASGFLPDGARSQWWIYFGTDDADATLAKIVKLGGSIVTAAEDTPYGRLATASDPTGAQFKLIAPTSSQA
jgi:predicted enzyme related to lactoylglutathione lyase